MESLESIETYVHSHGFSTFAFLLSIGLKEGDNAAYDVLDMYSATGGSFPGEMPPYFSTTLPVTQNTLEEGQNCAFAHTVSAGVTTITGNGQTNDLTDGFPEQCVLHADSGNNLTCIQQPAMWGNMTSATTANPLYVQAFGQALQDLGSFVNGAYSMSFSGHAFQLLKLSGIANHDEEVAIPGNPSLAMPPNGPSYFQCGDPSAMNAEEVWTDQSNSGTDAYESGIVESTWLSLVAVSTAVTSNVGGGYQRPVLRHRCARQYGFPACPSGALPRLFLRYGVHLHGCRG
jgi:hypothetical protein